MCNHLDFPCDFFLCYRLDFPSDPILFYTRAKNKKWNTARSERRQREYFDERVSAAGMQPISTPAPLYDMHSHQAEEVPVDSPSPSALPETTIHSHLISKKQFCHAVRAANLLAKKLKDQEEVVRRQKFHLLVLSSALKERKHNPFRVPGPTPKQQKEADEALQWIYALP
jgi:hypothetical protein